MENEKKYFEELLTKSSIEMNDEAKGKMLVSVFYQFDLTD